MATNIEEKKKSKRYVVSVSFYMWEDGDEQVKREALHFAAKMNSQSDCLATVDQIVESPFAKVTGLRKVM